MNIRPFRCPQHYGLVKGCIEQDSRQKYRSQGPET